MATQNASMSDRSAAILSRWRRDYHLSVAILVTGVFVAAAVSVFQFWASSTASYPASDAAGLAIDLIGTAAGVLIILGGIFAFHNWSLLRKGRRVA